MLTSIPGRAAGARRITRRLLLTALAAGLGASAVIPAAAAADTPPANAFAYGYDNLGRLAVASDTNAGAYSALYAWDPVANLKSITRQTSATVTVAQMVPKGAQAGSTVRLYGTGFHPTASSNTVKFNGTTATVTSALPGQLQVTVPAAASTGTVTLTTPAGSATSATPFTVLTDQSPTIASASASILAAGSPLTITGTKFQTTTTLDDLVVNRTRALVSAATATQLTTTVPGGAAAGALTLTTPGGTVTGPDLFIPPSGYTVANIGGTGRLQVGATTPAVAAAGTVGMYLVDAVKGKRIYLDVAATSLFLHRKLYDPRGRQLLDIIGDDIDLVAPMTGTYALVLDWGGSAMSTSVTAYAPPQDFTAPLTPTATGASTTVTTTTPGQNATVTFTGEPGQRISYALTSDTYTNGSVYCKLKTGLSAPDGSAVFAPACAQTAMAGPLVLNQDGTYTLTVDPQQERIGSVVVTVYLMPDDPAPALTPTAAGAQATITTVAPGQNATVTFTGEPGQRISATTTAMNLTGWTSPYCELELSLINPDASTLKSPTCARDYLNDQPTGFMETATLGQSGTYTLRVDPLNSIVGTMTVTVYLVPDDALTNVTPTSAGAQVSVDTPVPGQDGYVTFTGEPGQRISVTSTAMNYAGYVPPYCQVEFSMANPDASTLTAKACARDYLNAQAGGYIDTVTLNQSGTYKLRVNPLLAMTGSMTVNVYLVPDEASVEVTPSASGAQATLTNTTPGQDASVTFAGEPGQRIFVLMSAMSYTGWVPPYCLVERTLRNPDASVLKSSSCVRDYLSNQTRAFIDTVTLNQSGTYKLHVNPLKGVVGSMTVTTYLVPDELTTPVLVPTSGGASTNVAIATPGQTAAVRFDAVAGAVITAKTTNSTFAGPISGCAMYVSLINPDASTLYGSSCQTGTSKTLSATTLTQSGTHLVRLDPGAQTTGTITVTVTDPAGPAGATAATAGSPQALMLGGTSLLGPGATPLTDPARSLASQAPVQARPRPGSREDRVARRVERAAAQPRRLAAPRKRAGSARERRRYLLPADAQRVVLRTDAPAAWTPTKRNFHGDWTTHRADSPWAKLPPLSAAAGQTAVAGQVLALNGKPVAGVPVSLERTGVRARTDKSGRFVLAGAPAGHVVVHVDGAPRGFGSFEFGIGARAGRTTRIPFTIWLPKRDTKHEKSLSGLHKRALTLTTPAIPGLKVVLPKGTKVTGPDGKTIKRLGIVAVPSDRPPFPLPLGSHFPIYISVQPAGATLSRGAKLIYPNYSHMPAGQRVPFWNYDPGKRGWHVYGKGTVTRDAKNVVPDRGVRIWRLSGAMISGSSIPPWLKDFGKGLAGADPVNYGTGLFTYNKTDLQQPDILPVGVSRTYRPADNNSYSFGRGMTNSYDMRLFSRNNYQEAELILPDGMSVHMTCISGCDHWTTARYVSRDTPTQFLGATMRYEDVDNMFVVTTKSGDRYRFGDMERFGLRSISDRFGNEVVIDRTAEGYVRQATSPNGRWVSFLNDSSGRVTQATDNSGRVVRYDYNGQSSASACATATSTGPAGTLRCAKDPAGGEIYYTYDATSGAMTSVKDARGNVIVTNEYDANGRVTKQTLPGYAAPYTFVYELHASGLVSKSTVTDPTGKVTVLNLNTEGFPTTITHGAGTSLAQTTTYAHEAGSGLLRSTTDPRGRKTSYTYDPAGNIASVTLLDGTAQARTTTYEYEQQFGQQTKVIDPDGRVTSYGYTAGAMTSVTNAAGKTVTMQYANDDGLATKTIDALGNASTSTYRLGDLVKSTGPDGATTSVFVDTAGRATHTTDALGNTATATYDALNDRLSVTDADGKLTKFTYDASSNLKTIVDANNRVMSTLTHDALGRVLTRTDALGKVRTYTYDANGKLTSLKDAKNQTAVFAPDALGRVKTVTFKTATGTTQSTVTNTYDDANRLTAVADSAAGTYTQAFDDYDRLTQHAGPTGTVSYTYNADGTPKTTTVAGQPAVTYGYDDRGHMTSIASAAGNVTLSYDEVDRLQTTVLPGGVVRTYTYDDASRLTDILYTNGASALGDLHYAYDPAGRRTHQWGSWARQTVPAALTAGTFNAANQVTSQGGKSFSYDANGSLLTDGTYTYAWNARNQLTGLTSKARGVVPSSFTYDPFGRRKSKTHGTSTTSYLYDAFNVTQELSGSTPQANYLTGPGMNQLYARTDSAGTRAYLTDAQGSTVGLSAGGLNVPTSYTYDPFGAALLTGTASANTVKFTGALSDSAETGLQYSRARYYNPALGRFISQDPAGTAGSGTNLYGYAEGDPVNLSDPTGLSALMGLFEGGGCLAKILGGGKSLAGSLGCAVATGGEFVIPGAAYADPLLNKLPGFADDILPKLPSAADDIAKQADDAPMGCAMGLCNVNGKPGALKDFGKHVNDAGFPVQTYGQAGVSPYGAAGGSWTQALKKWMEDTVAGGGSIHFNLTGFDPTKTGLTQFEYNHIMSNPNLFNNTVWWLNGVQVPAPAR